MWQYHQPPTKYFSLGNIQLYATPPDVTRIWADADRLHHSNPHERQAICARVEASLTAKPELAGAAYFGRTTADRVVQAMLSNGDEECMQQLFGAVLKVAKDLFQPAWLEMLAPRIHDKSAAKGLAASCAATAIILKSEPNAAQWSSYDGVTIADKLLWAFLLSVPQSAPQSALDTLLEVAPQAINPSMVAHVMAEELTHQYLLTALQSEKKKNPYATAFITLISRTDPDQQKALIQELEAKARTIMTPGEEETFVAERAVIDLRRENHYMRELYDDFSQEARDDEDALSNARRAQLESLAEQVYHTIPVANREAALNDVTLQLQNRVSSPERRAWIAEAVEKIVRVRPDVAAGVWMPHYNNKTVANMVYDAKKTHPDEPALDKLFMTMLNSGAVTLTPAHPAQTGGVRAARRSFP